MKELFEYLKGLPPALSVIALLISLIILIILKWDTISKPFKKIKNTSKSLKRTCGDCVLILFGIREKYDHKLRDFDNSLLRSQMKFAEQKIQEAIFFLSQSFMDDIRIYGKEADLEKKVTQSALYCEALKNSMISVKDEFRRSFKENGFNSFSEVEFSHYVKSKSKTLLTMVRLYLNQYYVDGEGTIVRLKERFERMDAKNLKIFEGWVFEIFNNAKDLTNDYCNNKEEISEDLKYAIDDFINKGQDRPNC